MESTVDDKTPSIRDKIYEQIRKDCKKYAGAQNLCPCCGQFKEVELYPPGSQKKGPNPLVCSACGWRGDGQYGQANLVNDLEMMLGIMKRVYVLEHDDDGNPTRSIEFVGGITMNEMRMTGNVDLITLEISTRDKEDEERKG